jgi:phosphate transport system permease protein
MAIIASVLLILFLIVEVTLPLFRDARADLYARFTFPEGELRGKIMAAATDEYLETPMVLDEGGNFVFFDPRNQTVLGRLSAEPPGGADRLVSVESQGEQVYALMWNDGSLSVEKLKFRPVFDAEGRRTISRELERLAAFPPPDGGRPVRSLARVGDEIRLRIDLGEDGQLQVVQEAISVDFLGNEEKEAHAFSLEDAQPERVTALAVDGNGSTLYAGTDQGTLLRWDLAEAGSPELLERTVAFADRRAITALGLVLGDISLAVGDAKGGLGTWFPVAGESGGKRLRQIHALASHQAPVEIIQPSERDKSILSLDRNGILHLDHMTSERHLLTLDDYSELVHFGFSARGNGIVAVNKKGQAIVWTLDNPHPEISMQTLFGKVWYESYNRPTWVWQSSSASDDFEPKLSLTPLIYGTIKGTVYAMLFAIPLALLGAIYTSQFGSARVRQLIKPMVEIMAAIPSVVIGFLAALWLAPLLEKHISGFFLGLAFLPTSLILAILAWQGLRRAAPLKRVERGYEFLAILPVLVLAVAISMTLGPFIETVLFDGNFRQWLYEQAGARYDQRNCIVIAFALGFAVIPIIFTIAEDSLSNVPASLKAASLAMGASRWQTVWRVIIPSASPGIFAGTMIGFGRAIGETMIVLMATGNTAIMDWSIFNGMRPLSANIAVEIPEAPFGGTLYRILFLSAVILFALTFILNTAAEIVRQRLRKKYGRF